MKIENRRTGVVQCPECGNDVEVDVPAGTDIGEIGDYECAQGHSVRVRLDEKSLTVVPADLDL